MMRLNWLQRAILCAAGATLLYFSFTRSPRCAYDSWPSDFHLMPFLCGIALMIAATLSQPQS